MAAIRLCSSSQDFFLLSIKYDSFIVSEEMFCSFDAYPLSLSTLLENETKLRKVIGHLIRILCLHYSVSRFLNECKKMCAIFLSSYLLVDVYTHDTF